MSQLIEIGVVTRAHGLAGLVRVKVFAEDPTLLGRLSAVVLRLPDGREQDHVLESAQPGGKGLPVVQLRGCRHRDQAVALQGAELLVRRSALGPLAPGEFYLADAVGCVVETPDGDRLGTVVEIGDNGAQSLLLIQKDDRIHNVPAVAPFIADFDGRRLVLDLPDGLMEAVADEATK